MSRRVVFWRYVERWWRTLPQRANELVFWKKCESAWREGYGTKGLGTRAVLSELIIRLSELMGCGLLYIAIELWWSGGRYRVLTEVEKAFAKTYFSAEELDCVLIDEGSTVFAKRLDIAFVIGFAVKTYGPPDLPLLIHELVHVRQFRRWGWAYVAKALTAQNYGDGYVYSLNAAADEVKSWLATTAATAGNSVQKKSNLAVAVDDSIQRTQSVELSLNAEQEAARLEDLARVRCGFAPRWVA